MFTDLVLTDENLEGLGFSEVRRIKVISAETKPELSKRLKKGMINVVLGGRLNRQILEDRRVDILLSPENGIKEDSLHQRNSGLNHILCNLANKNNIAVAFNFNDVLKSRNIERAKILGRMMQNVRLCRKYKVKMILASFAKDKYEMRSQRDLVSFALTIGMTADEARKSLSNINEIIKEREFQEGIIALDD